MAAMEMLPDRQLPLLSAEHGPLLAPGEGQLGCHQTTPRERGRLTTVDHQSDDIGCEVAQLDEARELGTAATLRRRDSIERSAGRGQHERACCVRIGDQLDESLVTLDRSRRLGRCYDQPDLMAAAYAGRHGLQHNGSTVGSRLIVEVGQALAVEEYLDAGRLKSDLFDKAANDGPAITSVYIVE